MKNKDFKALLECMQKLHPLLTRSQREQLAQTFGDAQQGGGASAAKKPAPVQALAEYQPDKCPHCGGQHLVRKGIYHQLQRWQCKGCGKTFNIATGTPLARLRDKRLLPAYAQCMTQKLSVNKVMRAMDISRDKAFRWRHRALQGVVEHQPQAVSGILEADETYFRYSEKGSRQLTRQARHRGGGKGAGKGRRADEWVPVLVGRTRGQPYTLDKVLPRVNEQEVTEALRDAVTPGETLVCTDGHSAYRRLDKTLGVATGRVLAGYHGHANNTFHVQNVNNYHERIKTWIQRDLRGVATRNLPSYLAWHRMLTWDKDGLTADDIIRSALGTQIVNI